MSFIKINDIQIHYQLIGHGNPVIVFLHGLIIDNLSSWFFTVANPASQNSRVLLYDLRGHGYSERPQKGYTIEHHLLDLKNLLNALEINSPIILVGNSFGGLLAIQFARQFPESVQGLILIDSQLNTLDWKNKMVHSLDDGDKQDQLVEKSFPHWHGRNSSRKSNRLAENARGLLKKTDIIPELKSSEIALLEDIKSIATPTFAIYGANSEEVATGRALEANLQNCTLKIIEGCTHSVIWEKAEQVKTIILSALQILSQTDRNVNELLYML